MFLSKGVPKICSKFTGEHPCRSAISITLLCNFIKIALWHGCSPVNLLHVFRTPFPSNSSGWLLLKFVAYVSHISHIEIHHRNIALHKKVQFTSRKNKAKRKSLTLRKHKNIETQIKTSSGFASSTNLVPSVCCHLDNGRRRKWKSVRKATYVHVKMLSTSLHFLETWIPSLLLKNFQISRNTFTPFTPYSSVFIVNFENGIAVETIGIENL